MIINIIIYSSLIHPSNAILSNKFYNSKCVKDSKNTKIINAKHWKTYDTCNTQFLNTTKHDYLQKLYQYGITKNEIEKEIINLRQINAKSNFSTVTQYIPETRGTCLTHGHNNVTLSIHAIYGFTSFIECSKIACNEKQICNLDDDLNILDDDDETETCLSICAKRYMRCIHFNQDEYMIRI